MALIRVLRRNRMGGYWIRTSFLCLFLIIVWITMYANVLPPMSLHVIRSFGPKTKIYVQADAPRAILRPNICRSDTFLVIVVCSSVTRQTERQAIRETWGSITREQQDVRLAFLLGKITSPDWQERIEEESERRSDIIQEDFLDTYDNLTLKTVFLLRWVTQACSNAQFILKTDDDMFINVPNLLAHLKNKGRPRLLMGALIEGARPIRNLDISDSDSKWYAPNTYVDDSYPTYLSGSAYVISGDTVGDLFRVALNTSLFRLEDIFITGICAERLGLVPTDNLCFHYADFDFDSCRAQRIISAHRQSAAQLYRVWQELHNPALSCENFIVRKYYQWVKPLFC